MKLDINDFKDIINCITETMHENKDYLIELDQVMGDGDLGLTMTKGFDAASGVMEDTGDDIGTSLFQASMAMNNAASSTMGTLLSSGIMRAGKIAKGEIEVNNRLFVEMAEAVVQGIKDRGKAKIGDKTILDALVPAVEAIKKEINSGNSLLDAFVRAAEAARKGVEATKDMVSQHGRAHYYGEKSRGKQDPGATVAQLSVEAVRDYLEDYN